MVLLRSQSFISLFDIRIKSTADRNVIVLRGSPEDAASVLLSGSVVFSVNDPLSIKKITLKLTGTLRLNWLDNSITARGPVTKPVRYETVLFDHEWDNLESGGGLVGLSSGTGSTSRSGSSTSLSSTNGIAGGLTNSTSSSISGGSNSSSSRTLSQGNHELPFEMVIPGDAPESVEGLEGAQMVYRLVATVERGRFSNNLVAKKHIRIVRTIGADSFELSQTVSIENTWPSKVDYSIEIPSKAVAVGSLLPVHFKVVPLLKGLKLGNIKVQLAEFISLSTPFGSTHSFERACSDHLIRAPEDGFVGRDAWEIDEMVPLPTSLSKCTQDCALGSYIKVAHKVKFAVSLVNPDGHVSELRASLPIYLFISPNVPISYLDPTVLQVPGSSRHPEEEILFAASSSSSNSREQSSTAINTLNGSAPPNYEDHIYDRLWSDVPTPSLDSPEGSVTSTPHLRSRRGSFDYESLGMTSLDPVQRSQLAAGLRALELQQQQNGSPGLVPVNDTNNNNNNNNNTNANNTQHSSRSASGTNTPYVVVPITSINGNASGGITGTSPTASTSPAINSAAAINGFSSSGDYFQQFHSVAHLSPDISHLSRVGTPLIAPHTPPDIDINVLSKVPSYSTALRNDATGEGEWAPGYEPSDSGTSSPKFGSSPLTLPGIAHLSSALTSNTIRRSGGVGQNSHVSSASGSSAVLNTLGSVTYPVQSTIGSAGSISNGSSGHTPASLSRNSSSTGLNFMHRSSSSRSLFEEASRLIRLTPSDKGGSSSVSKKSA